MERPLEDEFAAFYAGYVALVPEDDILKAVMIPAIGATGRL